MPYRRFDSHEHIKDVEGEYRATRLAVDRLKSDVVASPTILIRNERARAYLNEAQSNLEGTYLVRLFAAFESALRSYDRARHKDPLREEKASVLIDSISGRRGQGIPNAVREAAHDVRRVRNFWAHEIEEAPAPMSLSEARARLQKFLSWLPDEWG